MTGPFFFLLFPVTARRLTGLEGFPMLLACEFMAIKPAK